MLVMPAFEGTVASGPEKVMLKMKAGSLADLVKLAQRLGD
jgi:hypothetical protein